jgi:hypothetical protein
VSKSADSGWFCRFYSVTFGFVGLVSLLGVLFRDHGGGRCSALAD